MKTQMHISSLVLVEKRPSPELFNRVDTSIAAQKNIVSRLQRRQPRRGPHRHQHHRTLRSQIGTFFLGCNATDEKKFSALQKNLHCKKSTLWQRA
jgi:hypothetical protein